MNLHFIEAFRIAAEYESGPGAIRGLGRVRALASGAMREEHVDTWLGQPIEDLDGNSPIDLIKRGEAARVIEMFYDLAYGFA